MTRGARLAWTMPSSTSWVPGWLSSASSSGACWPRRDLRAFAEGQGVRRLGAVTPQLMDNCAERKLERGLAVPPINERLLKARTIFKPVTALVWFGAADDGLQGLRDGAAPTPRPACHGQRRQDERKADGLRNGEVGQRLGRGDVRFEGARVPAAAKHRKPV